MSWIKACVEVAEVSDFQKGGVDLERWMDPSVTVLFMDILRKENRL